MIKERTVPHGNVSMAVLEMIAEFEDRELHGTTVRLYDYIDGEALDQLVASGTADLTVEFRVDNYDIRISGDGTVAVAATQCCRAG